MKRNVMMVGLMMVSSLVFAQQKGDPRDRGSKQLEEMKTTLELTDDQFNSVKNIQEEYSEKQSQLRSDSALSKESKHKQMGELRKEKESEIQQVLTKEQNEKRVAQRMERSKKHHMRMSKSKVGYSNYLQKELSLDETQMQKVKAIDQEFIEKSRQLKEERDEKVKSVLTEEQNKKWQEKKGSRKTKGKKK